MRKDGQLEKNAEITTMPTYFLALAPDLLPSGH